MSKSERQGPGVRGQGSVRGRRRRVLYCLLLTACCQLFTGCRQDMQDQPRYEAYEASGFFKDGLSSRPIVEGTVARGYLRSDKQLYTGQKDKAQANTSAGAARPAQQGNTNTKTSGDSNMQAGGNAGAQTRQTSQAAGANSQQPAGTENDVEEFPFAVTPEVVERGRERYEIFCAMCHGYTGDGDGMIVRRGFRKPPSYHEEPLRKAHVGYFFRVMTEGVGAMPSYKAQVPVQDRWAIAAYIRALQLSRMNQQQGVPPAPAPAAHGANTETGGHE